MHRYREVTHARGSLFLFVPCGESLRGSVYQSLVRGKTSSTRARAGRARLREDKVMERAGEGRRKGPPGSLSLFLSLWPSLGGVRTAGARPLHDRSRCPKLFFPPCRASSPRRSLALSDTFPPPSLPPSLANPRARARGRRRPRRSTSESPGN